MDTNNGIDQFPEHDLPDDAEPEVEEIEDVQEQPGTCADPECMEVRGPTGLCDLHAQELAAEADGTTPTDPEPKGEPTPPAGPGLLESKRFKRELVCRMDENELAGLAKRLAAAVTAHDLRETEIKEEAKAGREELGEMYEEVKRLSRIVTQGGEEREVECMLIRNDKEGSIETVRCDTGEIIDRRAQDAEERQLPLRPLRVPDEDARAECSKCGSEDEIVVDGLCADCTPEPQDRDETPEELKGERCCVIVDQERCESPAATGDLYCQEHIDDGAADEAQCTNFYGGSRCRRPKKEGEEYCAECIADDEAFEKEQEATAPATPAAKARKGKAKKGRRK